MFMKKEEVLDHLRKIASQLGDKNKINILNTILRKLGIRSFVGGVSSKRFIIFEHDDGLKINTKKGPSS